MRTPFRRRRATITVALLLVCLAIVVWYRWQRLPGTAAGWAARVDTIAGDGSPGYAAGRGAAARFADPFGVAVDAAGRIYVADAGENNRIRRIDPDGLVTTVAGGREGFADGMGADAAFHTPSGMALDALGNLYVADTGNHAIRRVTPAGEVTTVAGDGTSGDRDGPPHRARFNAPVDVAVAPDGTIFVADTYNDRIRRIDPSGMVTTVAGGTMPGYRDGPADDARFDTPCGIALLPSGALVVADTGNGVVRVIAADGLVRTLEREDEVPVPLFAVSTPVGVAVSHDGFVYVTGHWNGRIVQITPDRQTHVMAGSRRGFGDGAGDAARFRTPAGIAIDPEGGLVVADAGNYLIRRIRAADAPRRREAPLAPPVVIDGTLPRLLPELFSAGMFPWPVEPQHRAHEVVGTMGEVRGTGTDPRARLHGGIDIRAPAGALVRAVRDEKVRTPLAPWGFGADSEGVAVDLVSYIHIRVGRTARDTPLAGTPFLPVLDEDGRVVRIRVRRGERFRVGDPLGTVNALVHVHLELGPPGAQINPLHLPLVDLVDTTPPVIVRDGIRLFDEGGQRLTERRHGRLLVRGPVRITLEAYDRVDGNLPRRRLGLYRAGYQILESDGRPAAGFERPRVTIAFDRLPSLPYAGPLVYAESSGIASQDTPVTRFVYLLTNTLRDGHVEEGVWDSGTLPPGNYILRVLAADYHGNESEHGRDLPITIEPVM